MKRLIPALFLAFSALPADAAVRSYFSPAIDGARLEACIETGCGKPAADAFCAMQGYEKALTFMREPAAQGSELVRPGGSAFPAGTDSMMFRQIKCFSQAPVAVAASE
ncbi:MAG: hypothetical protein ACKVP5_11270 [Aestuariivirga sp.]